MNYQRIHDQIIARAQNREIDGYTERHHIIPKCMGGDDEPENIVVLTAREHFVIHQLLVKIYPDVPGLVYAACAMAEMSAYFHDRSKNRMYEWLKIKKSKTHSKRMIAENPFRGKKLSKDHRRKISEANRGRKLNSSARQKISAAHLGKKRPQKWKDNMSKTKRGNKHNLFGWFWITNGFDSKMIAPDMAIPNGWKRGRHCRRSVI